MITLEFEGPVALATLCRPPVNAINDLWIARMHEVLDEVERRHDTQVLWIRSAERVFSAGADLALMRERFDSHEGRARMIEFTRGLQALYMRIERSPKVSIAEIGGSALGGGFELALACDLRIVADDARVGLPEAALGLLPGAGGTQRMTRIAGDAVARQLILGAEVIDGVRAVSLGLAHRSVPGGDLRATARSLAERIGALPGPALAACKRCITAALDVGVDGFEVEIEGTAQLLADPGTQRLVRAFLSR